MVSFSSISQDDVLSVLSAKNGREHASFSATYLFRDKNLLLSFLPTPMDNLYSLQFPPKYIFSPLTKMVENHI